MRKILFLLMAFASTALAQPLVELDFNNSDGDASLENRGSKSLTFEFSGVGAGSEKPSYSSTIPSVNAGGNSAFFNRVDPSGGNPSRQYINGGSVPELDNLVSLTLTGWLYYQPYESPAPGYIFNRRENSDDAFGFFLYRNASGKFVFRAGDGGVAEFSAETPSEEWVFFAVTLDASSSTDNLKLYIGDGETLSLVHTRSYTLASGNIGSSTAQLWIGNDARRERAFSGYLDNLRIYGSTTDASGAIGNLSQLESIMTFNDASAIPEPATVSLLSTALLVFLRLRFQR